MNWSLIGRTRRLAVHGARLGVLAGFLGLMTLGVASALAAEEGSLTVLEVSGVVNIAAIGSDSGRPLKAGDLVVPQNQITTGEDAFCRVKVGATGNRRLWIQENSAVAYSLDQNRREKIRVLAGTLLANVKGLNSGEEFAVENPLAVASVRGSGFAITADGYFRSFEHTLYIETFSGQKMELAEGYGVVLNSDGQFTAAQVLSEEQKKDWLSWGLTSQSSNGRSSGGKLGDSFASIMDVKDGYYMSSSCQTVRSCDNQNQSEDQDGKKAESGKGGKTSAPNSKLQDLQVMIGDQAKLPLRVQLPLRDSKVRIGVGPNTEVELSGVMLACLEGGSGEGGGDALRAKVFQAGHYSMQVDYKDGKTIVKITSGNNHRLSRSKVSVSEGSVRHTVPDLCKSCFAENETIVAAGECAENNMADTDPDWDQFDDNLRSDADSGELKLPYRS